MRLITKGIKWYLLQNPVGINSSDFAGSQVADYRNRLAAAEHRLSQPDSNGKAVSKTGSALQSPPKSYEAKQAAPTEPSAAHQQAGTSNGATATSATTHNGSHEPEILEKPVIVPDKSSSESITMPSTAAAQAAAGTSSRNSQAVVTKDQSIFSRKHSIAFIAVSGIQEPLGNEPVADVH